MNIITSSRKTAHSYNPVQPLALGGSLLYFALPALLLVLGFHVIMPALIQGGMLPFYAYAVSLGIPLALMLAASLIAFRLEGNPMTWPALKERFRLHRMDRKTWLWTAATFGVMFVGYGIFSQIDRLLIVTGIMPLPASLPAFLDPVTPMPPMTAVAEAAGGLAGNWPFLLTYVLLLFFNIIGEEFWWRGYILPRQEAAFGQKTWLIHGVLWAVFHVFKWWDVIGLLPVTLALTFTVVRLKNNTPGIIVHALFNSLGLIPITLAVLGII